MTRPFISFYSATSSPVLADEPAVASSRVSRDAAAEQFRSALAPARAADTAPAPSLTDPSVAVAVPYRFGNGPRPISPPPNGAAYQFLKRSQIAQALFDVFTLGFLLFFVFVASVAVVGAVAFLVSFLI